MLNCSKKFYAKIAIPILLQKGGKIAGAISSIKPSWAA